MDSVRVSAPSLLLAHGFSSSNIHHPPSVSHAPPLLSEPGKWVMMGDKEEGFIFASQTNRLPAKSRCYLPVPVFYLFTFSQKSWRPRTGYLSTVRLQISQQHDTGDVSFGSFYNWCETMQICARSRHWWSPYHEHGWQRQRVVSLGLM